VERKPQVLDSKADALVRVTALVALGAPDAPCRTAVARALDAGVSPEGIVEALVNVSAIIGIARVVSAAPAIASALGCSVDPALLG
jgi:alkylhydroperoxidase/carboxymuconolactone decarboxylase family protein YurZ